MPLSRRHFLLTGTTAPLLAACASDLSRYQGDAMGPLATRLGVCSAVYTTLESGQTLAPTALGGCKSQGPARVDAVFQAASLTKPLVAFGALRLALADQLDLQAPVSKYLPRGYVHYHSVLQQNPGDASDTVAPETLARIPLATLLNHTCGLPNWTKAALVPGFTPGTRWSYSGEAYMLLQAVMEAVTGMRITQFMDAHVFEPLGMHDSSLVWQERLAGRMVQGETAPGVPSRVRFRAPVAAASLYTTAADYARFLVALANDAQVMALTLSQPVDVDAALGLQWGYGWGIERVGSNCTLWQWGNNPGFRSFAMLSAVSGSGFVILTNAERGMPLAVPLAHRTLPTNHNAFRLPMVG